MLIQSLLLYSFILFTLTFLMHLVAKRESYRIENGDLVKEQSFWNPIIIFTLLLFSVFFGMRYDVGTDHIAYLSAYIKNEDVSKGEPLFNGITVLFQNLNIHFVFYFSFLAFIQVLFFFYAFKNEKYLFPFLILFLFTTGEVFGWMNIIRQSIAFCIWVFSLKYIYEKKLWKYIIWCLIAAFFHKSALILIVLYPILKNGKDLFSSVFVQILLIIIAFLIETILIDVIILFTPIIEFYISLLGNDKYAISYNVEQLIEIKSEKSGSGMAYLAVIAVNFLIILYSQNLKEYFNSKRFNTIYTIYFFGLLTLYSIPNSFIVLTRPFRYFNSFHFIMLAFFCFYLFKSNNVNNKNLGYIIVLLYLGIFYLNHITSNEDAHLWYQFYTKSKEVSATS